MDRRDDTPTNAAVGRPMTQWEVCKSRVQQVFYYWRRKLPYLVWYNDEMDVTVTFSRERLKPDTTMDDAWGALFGTRLAQVEEAIRQMDITFDRGVGLDGRDWEWDWSLKGPVSVRFRGRAKKPELRSERARPRLVCSK